MTDTLTRYRYWAGFVVPFIGMTLFWADFGHSHGTYPHRLFVSSLVGVLAATLSFIVTYRLVNPMLRYLDDSYDRASTLPNGEL